MRRQFGEELAGRLSRRLQQLEAMTSLNDLSFMPFEFAEHPRGVIEIAVDVEISLFVREVQPAQKDGRMPSIALMVSAISTQTMTTV